MKQRTKISAILMAMVLMITAICNHGVVAEAAVKVGNGRYTVTSEKNKTARFDKVSSKTKTTLVIPATVKIGKKTYKVTAIKANALKGNKKIKKLTIGKNVKKIGKQAFYGCKNLKSITIKTTKLQSVGKKAFGKLYSKAVVQLPKLSDSKVKSYEKMLRGGGLTGKKQVIKTNQPSGDTSSKKPTTSSTPTVAFRTGPLTEEGYLWKFTTTETDCAVGETVEFAARIDNPIDYYGYWEEKQIKSDFKISCTVYSCRQTFGTNEDWGIHGLQTGHTGYVILKKKNNVFNASVWHPDNTPFSIVYHMVLPEGMELVKERISVAQLSQIGTLLDAVDSGHYKVNTDGRSLTITIDNIKTGNFCSPSGKVHYMPIVASFSAKVTDSASAVNSVVASVSYNCGKNSGVIDTNTVTINKK